MYMSTPSPISKYATDYLSPVQHNDCIYQKQWIPTFFDLGPL